MKKNLLKSLFVLLFAVAGSSLFAENAVVTYVKGKVEVNRNNEWIALSIGDEIKQSDTISTGFQSEAKIKYNGSLLSLGAVTRITLSELSSGKGKETVDLNLSTGAVRSKVTHTEDTRISYTVRSPAAVASVRGTDFMMSDNGKVTCYEGAVVVYPASKAKKKAQVDEEVAEEEESEETEEGEATESTEAVAENTESTESGDSVETSEELPGAYGPATATTDANEIDMSAPAGAVVVGANQSTQFNSFGNPEKPMDTAEKQSKRAKSNGQTAAEKEAVSAGSAVSTKTQNQDKTSDEVRKGILTITVDFE